MIRTEQSFIEQIEKIEAHCIEINSINGMLNSLKHEFEQFRIKNYVSNESFDSNNKQISFSIGDVKQSLCTQFQMIKYTEEEIRDILNKVKEFELNFDDAFVQIHKGSIETSTVKESLTAKLNNEIKNILIKLSEFKEDYTKLINDLKNEFIASPISILESNKNLINKIESSQIDASNAVLKFNNFEMNFRILEKKFENLDLRVKKIELSQQL